MNPNYLSPLSIKIIFLTAVTHALAVYPFFRLDDISPALWAWFIFWYTFSSLGVTVGLHRYFTHKSFKTGRWTKIVLGFMGMTSLRGGIDFWVGLHRSHHKHADRTDDTAPLDPYNAGLGFWHGYLGWALTISDKDAFVARFKKFAPDISADPDLWFFNIRSMDLYFNLVLGAASYALFGFLGLALILGLRLTLMHQAVYLTNSIGHGHGWLNYRNFKRNDLSSNNFFLAFLAWGDGWHNNHHAFPTSAKNGARFWEFDPSHWFITALEQLGLAYDVNRSLPELKGFEKVQEA